MDNYRIYDVIPVIETYLSELGINDDVVLKEEYPEFCDDICKIMKWKIEPIVTNNKEYTAIVLSKYAIDELLSVNPDLSVEINREILKQCLI